jgi:hypothetical protein
MPGMIKSMINKIVAERAKGNATLIATTRTKLILKGIDPDKFNDTSPDDPAIMGKLQTLATELNIIL